MKRYILLTALALVIVAALIALPSLRAKPPSANASAVDGYALYTWTNNGITASANGAGRWTADYGRFECYQTIDATLFQTVTLTFQASPDNTNWSAIPAWQFATNVLAVGTGFAAVSTDGTTFGITVLEGLYTRPVFTLGASNPITVTLRCVGKDRPGYDIDQQAGALESTDP
jgi:hypothetical protein